MSSNSPPTIIALTETWLDHDIKACETFLPSYMLIRWDHDRHGGGIAIYIHDSSIVRSSSVHLNYELLSVDLDTKDGIILICIVYRPPGFDNDLSLLESSIG